MILYNNSLGLYAEAVIFLPTKASDLKLNLVSNYSFTKAML